MVEMPGQESSFGVPRMRNMCLSTRGQHKRNRHMAHILQLQPRPRRRIKALGADLTAVTTLATQATHEDEDGVGGVTWVEEDRLLVIF